MGPLWHCYDIYFNEVMCHREMFFHTLVLCDECAQFSSVWRSACWKLNRYTGQPIIINFPVFTVQCGKQAWTCWTTSSTCFLHNIARCKVSAPQYFREEPECSCLLAAHSLHLHLGFPHSIGSVNLSLLGGIKPIHSLCLWTSTQAEVGWQRVWVFA